MGKQDKSVDPRRQATLQVICQSRASPSEILFAFDEMVRPGFDRALWAVAYVTERGSRRLTQHIVGRVGQDGWNSAEKVLLTSFDYGITEPHALRYLSEEEGFNVLVSDPTVVERPGFRPVASFHPKAYGFLRGDTAHAIIGSANLTESALSGNTEIVSAGEITPVALWLSLWDRLVTDATTVDDAMLRGYQDARDREPDLPPHEQPDPMPTIRPGDLQTVWTAIDGGSLVPATFDRFWIEAGSMSSGGSHNQLELPRGMNQFFGFTFSDYDDKQTTIGSPMLVSGPRVWNNAPLTWHGNNRMERINLPTQAQGGFVYANTAILFRRRDDSFELVVLPWNSPVAESWRRASSLIDQVYRLGETSNRICGLF